MGINARLDNSEAMPFPQPLPCSNISCLPFSQPSSYTGLTRHETAMDGIPQHNLGKLYLHTGINLPKIQLSSTEGNFFFVKHHQCLVLTSEGKDGK